MSINPISILASLKAIVFDAYGTLFDVYSLGAGMQGYFEEKTDAINQVWRTKQIQYTWLRDMMGAYKPFSEVTAEALDYACQANGVELPNELRDSLMEEYIQLPAFPEVPKLLKALAQHKQLAILSNADQLMLDGAIARNGIGDYLSAVISVDEIGRFKPAPVVYQLAEKKLGLDKSEIGFVSSNTWDVAGAMNYGLQVIWLNRGIGAIETHAPKPKFVIKTLGDLL